MLKDPRRRHLALTVAVAAGLAAYLTGRLRTVAGFDLAVVLTLAGGFPIYWAALSGIARGRISADLAVGIAAVAALVIGQYAVAAEVVLIMLIGEALEEYTVDRTRAGIESLLALRPREARVRRDGVERVVPLSEVRKGEVVLLRPGERIPVDGRVRAGHSSVDQSPMTGESLPADKAPGDEVFAGTINLHGALEVEAVRVGDDTTLAHIIHLVEEAEAARAPVQRLADRYARWFVPVVLAAAGTTWWFTRDMTRAVAVLVVACPCALVLATPTAIAAGIGALVRRGLLVKGGAVLEQLGRLKAVVFDKTGTLTLARLEVARVVAAPGVDETAVLRIAAAVESRSEHPLGRAIVEHARSRGVAAAESDAFRSHPGQGAEVRIDGTTVRAGNGAWLTRAGVEVCEPLAGEIRRLEQDGCTVVLVANGERMAGAVGIRDTVRPEAREAIAGLRAAGIARLPMLTGDSPAAAKSVAAALGLAEVHAGLLPPDKAARVRQLQAEIGPVAMVGDGVNDAPALAAADVGLAMADVGSDVAMESAGVVLVGGDLRKVAWAVATARRVRRTIAQNILGFALGFNAMAVAAAALGWIGPVIAAVLHQVSSLTVVLNSMRILVDGDRIRRALGTWQHALIAQRARIAWNAAALTLAAWLLSGVFAVRTGEVAIVQRFGRNLGAPVLPGLHYRWPRPLGFHTIVRPLEARRVEIGFRTTRGDFAEPPAYDWNVQHRGGRYDRQADEAAVWTGDESLADVNLVVQYRVSDPREALFAIGRRGPDGADKWDTLIRNFAESALRAEVSGRSDDEILAVGRTVIEEAIVARLREALARSAPAFEALTVRLGDTHPLLEVVPAFREVAAALEEKEAAINDAEAYQFETEALARGQAQQRVVGAGADGRRRELYADGESARFSSAAAAYREAPAITGLRLYLSTVEQLLAGRRKVILDPASAAGRRMLWLGRSGFPAAPPALGAAAAGPAASAVPPNAGGVPAPEAAAPLPGVVTP